MDYLVLSPTLQTSTIKCTNGTITRVQFEQATKIHVAAGCSIKLTKEDKTSSESAKITRQALRYNWSLGPFTLQYTLLSNLAHCIKQLINLR
jgi:hypothetical protein